MIQRIPPQTIPGDPAPQKAAEKDGVWVELSLQPASYEYRELRGRLRTEDFERLVSGQATGFLRLFDCYWFKEADFDEEWDAIGGEYTRLGSGRYSNFTGEMLIRCDTVVSFALLKGGIDDEPSQL